MGVGERLKESLKNKSLTIKQLSEVTGISSNTLYSITKRDNESIGLEPAQQIASVLGVDVNWLRHGYTLEDRDTAMKSSVHRLHTNATLQEKLCKLNAEGLDKVVDYVNLLILSGLYERQDEPRGTKVTVYGDGPSGSYPPRQEGDDNGTKE